MARFGLCQKLNPLLFSSQVATPELKHPHLLRRHTIVAVDTRAILTVLKVCRDSRHGPQLHRPFLRPPLPGRVAQLTDPSRVRSKAEVSLSYSFLSRTDLGRPRGLLSMANPSHHIILHYCQLRLTCTQHGNVQPAPSRASDAVCFRVCTVEPSPRSKQPIVRHSDAVVVLRMRKAATTSRKDWLTCERMRWSRGERGLIRLLQPQRTACTALAPVTPLGAGSAGRFAGAEQFSSTITVRTDPTYTI